MAQKCGPVSDWTPELVAEWLCENGLGDYAELLTVQHRVDGGILLTLTDNDLRLPPLQLTVLGDIKRLAGAIAKLRASESVASSRLLNDDVLTVEIDKDHHDHALGATDELHGQPGVSTLNGSLPQGQIPDSTYLRFSEKSSVTSSERHNDEAVFNLSSTMDIHGEEFILKIESPDTPSKSLIKTLLAFLYFAVALFITSFIMVIVHDRVPDMKKYPPLPDIFLDNLPLIPWAFLLSEFLACFMGLMWTLVIFFHKHRLILLRRMFSLTGTVFLLRCVTMLITSMSVPGVHLECSGKTYGDFRAKLSQAFHIWFGMGLSLSGVRTCGDYMFSGHTVALTMLNHFITEYTPETWFFVHTAVWVMNLFGTFFILAGHEHYSIDVFVAFFISSRLFLYYHSMAYAASHLSSTDGRTRMWFPLFWFFESGGQVGRVRNEYEWPLPKLATIRDFVNGRLLLAPPLLLRWRTQSKRRTSLASVGQKTSRCSTLNGNMAQHLATNGNLESLTELGEPQNTSTTSSNNGPALDKARKRKTNKKIAVKTGC